MVFNRYRIFFIIRLLVLGGLILLFLFCIDQYQWYVTSAFVGALVVGAVIELILYSERYKKDLNNLLGTIQNRDFTAKVYKLSDSKDDMIARTIKELVHEFENVRIEKEVHYHYLNAIINHISIGLLSFDHNGKVQYINKAVKELLNLGNLSRIKELVSVDKKLFKICTELKPGEKELYKSVRGGEVVQLIIHITEFKRLDHTYRLISFQDIGTELESQELESWQKLIRVLTHEIMNSVTPISSLSEAMNDSLQEATIGKPESNVTFGNKDFNDLKDSLQAIESRSKGLLNFVKNYKDVTRIPKPEFESIDLHEIIKHCIKLLEKEIQENNVEIQYDYPDQNVIIVADFDLIQQVVLNLLLNAMDAMVYQNKKELRLNVLSGSRVELHLTDNGKGISQEEQEKIFIPFYTTKEQGSGIGLSLSRQIMRLHKGNIYISSNPDVGTTVILRF